MVNIFFRLELLICPFLIEIHHVNTIFGTKVKKFLWFLKQTFTGTFLWFFVLNVESFWLKFTSDLTCWPTRCSKVFPEIFRGLSRSNTMFVLGGVSNVTNYFFHKNIYLLMCLLCFLIFIFQTIWT